jgi:hypothetical protein
MVENLSQITTDWRLPVSLKCIQEMLPFLAASGHNNYVKSVQIHLQDMLELKDTIPDI